MMRQERISQRLRTTPHDCAGRRIVKRPIRLTIRRPGAKIFFGVRRRGRRRAGRRADHLTKYKLLVPPHRMVKDVFI